MRRVPFTLLVSILLPIPILCIAPVHPDAPDHHTLQTQHSRNQYKVQPELLHPAFCKGITNERCLQWDTEMKANARNLQYVIKTNGFVRVLVLLMKFTDHIDKESPPIEEYNLLFNDPGQTPLITPSGSISSWFHANSYGTFNIEAEIVPWHVTDNTEKYYADGKSGISHDFRFSMYPILDQLEAEGFDFSPFDLNNDGLIDSIVLLHSGYAAEIGGEDCFTNATTIDRIWSHAIAIGGDDQWTSSDGSIRANGYVVGSAYPGTCKLTVAHMSVLTHEFMHTLGLPDLNDNSNEWIGRGLGDFDLMANAHGRSRSQLYPAHLSPWCKMQLNWIVPKEITQDGEYDIIASELQDDILVIKKFYPDGEYLYIENRQPILWDTELWTGGILIWHIDESKESGGMQAERGYPGQEGWPGNQRHYGIAIEAADRRYDLEVGNNDGDAEDFWIQGMVYSSGPTQLEAKVERYDQYPNSNSYLNGTIYQSGITIRILTPSQETMRVQVTGLSNATPSPTQKPSEKKTLDPTATPTWDPTAAPTWNPTVARTRDPTTAPTRDPTAAPTRDPTAAPTRDPTTAPTWDLTAAPTLDPTAAPTWDPTAAPTLDPTAAPTLDPTAAPTWDPTTTLTWDPTTAPTWDPTTSPTWDPTATPTWDPTTTSTSTPTIALTTSFPTMETNFPTVQTNFPTMGTSFPTILSSPNPTTWPTELPTLELTIIPTAETILSLTNAPITDIPSHQPSNGPSNRPTYVPTARSASPSENPIRIPTDHPTTSPVASTPSLVSHSTRPDSTGLPSDQSPVFMSKVTTSPAPKPTTGNIFARPSISVTFPPTGINEQTARGNESEPDNVSAPTSAGNRCTWGLYIYCVVVVFLTNFS